MYRMSDEEWEEYLAYRAKHKPRGRIRQRETKHKHKPSDRHTRPSRMPREYKPKPINKSTKYYFINGDLHHIDYVHKPMDILRATKLFNNKKASEGQKVEYLYSAAKRKMQRAYSTTEVAGLINRSSATLRKDMYYGFIEYPFFLPQPTEYTPYRGKYLWTRDQIMRAHEFYSTRRKKMSGEWYQTSVPPRREVESLLDGERRIYVETDDGRFVPLWREADF